MNAGFFCWLDQRKIHFSVKENTCEYSSRTITVIIRTPVFRDGFTQGRQGFYRAINVGNRVKEDVIVDIVRSLTEIAVEGWFSEDLLRCDVGILAEILTNCASIV